MKRIAIVGWVTGFIASILFHIAWPLAHYALWKAAHAEIPESEALADR